MFSIFKMKSILINIQWLEDPGRLQFIWNVFIHKGAAVPAFQAQWRTACLTALLLLLQHSLDTDL